MILYHLQKLLSDYGKRRSETRFGTLLSSEFKKNLEGFGGGTKNLHHHVVLKNRLRNFIVSPRRAICCFILTECYHDLSSHSFNFLWTHILTLENE